VPQVSVLQMYGELGLYVGASVRRLALLDAFVGVTTHKLTTIYAAARVNIFYWFAFPVVYQSFAGASSPGALNWVARVLLFGLTGSGWRVPMSRRACFSRRPAPPSPCGCRTRSIAGHSAAGIGSRRSDSFPTTNGSWAARSNGARSRGGERAADRGGLPHGSVWR